MTHSLILLVAIFVLLALFQQGELSECTNPFTRLGDKFFYIEKHQKLSWFAAAVRCIQLGGQLATIENEKELNEISSHLVTQGYTVEHKDWLWISGIGKPGAFLAFSDPPRILPYAKWEVNEPNDVGSREDCLCIHRRRDEFLMNDWDCRIQAQFICETNFPFDVAGKDVRSAFLFP